MLMLLVKTRLIFLCQSHHQTEWNTILYIWHIYRARQREHSVTGSERLSKISFLYVCMVNTIYLLSFVVFPQSLTSRLSKIVKLYLRDGITLYWWFAFDIMAAMLGGTTQRNILFVPLSDPAGVGGWHCVQHPERLIANQQEYAFIQALTQLVGKTASMKRCYVKSWSSSFASL